MVPLGVTYPGLLSNANLSDSAYDWMRILKYHMEIRTVLQAKADVTDFRDDMAIQTSVVKADVDGETKERRTSVVKPVASHHLGACRQSTCKPLRVHVRVLLWSLLSLTESSRHRALVWLLLCLCTSYLYLHVLYIAHIVCGVVFYNKSM